jgi:hypothetical protein
MIPPGAGVDSEFGIGVVCPHAQATAIARDKPSRHHRQVSAFISKIDGIIKPQSARWQGKSTKRRHVNTSSDGSLSGACDGIIAAS